MCSPWTERRWPRFHGAHHHRSRSRRMTSFDIGQDTAQTGRRSMIEYRYDSPFKFTGKINKLTFKLEPSQMSPAEKKVAQDKVGDGD